MSKEALIEKLKALRDSAQEQGFYTKMGMQGAFDAAIASVNQHTDWQDISTAPRSGIDVLLYFPLGYWADDRNIAVGFWSKDDWYDSEAASSSMTAFKSFPTHWMPLPPKPE